MHGFLFVRVHFLTYSGDVGAVGLAHQAILKMFRVSFTDLSAIMFYFLYFSLGDRKNKRILTPAEICDLLKAVILLVCSTIMVYVDTNMLYHLIKSQSVIKLYIFYNMLEIGDRLFSAFGQDTIDALFWTATEPRGRKREHLGTVPHLLFAIVYVSILKAKPFYLSTYMRKHSSSR